MNTRLTLAAMFAVMLAGCGGADDSETREQQIEAAASRYGVDADVEIDENTGDATSIEIQRGDQTIGQNLDLPAGFPQDVPTPADWNIFHVGPAASGFMIQASTLSDLDTALSTLREAYAGQGWSEAGFQQSSPAMTQVSFEKDDRMTNVNLIDSGGDQLNVQLLTMKKP